VTPDRWVHKWGEWIEAPEDAAMETDLVAEIVHQAKEMERASGKPLNLEWAYDGEQLYWLQQREITTISGLNFYSNRIPKEFMPGIINPLVWSVNIPVVCGAWIRLLTEVIGDNDLKPNELARQFYHRAYFNMGVIGEVFDLLGMPREGLELLMGLAVAGKEKPRMKPGLKAIKLIPHIIRLVLDKAFYSGKFERFLFEHEDKCRQFNLSDVEKLDDMEIIQIIDELFTLNEEAAYNLIVSYLLSSIYSMMLRGRLEKLGLSIEEIDMGADKYRDIDPSHHLSVLCGEYRNLPSEAQRKIVDLRHEQLSACEELKGFLSKVEDFIHRFGHLSDRGNDFSSAPWREDPDLVMGMVVSHGQEGVVMGPRRSAVFPGGPLNRWATGAIHRRAIKHREYKERISFLYTYSYGLFRPYFTQIGGVFKEKGYINDERDIFYLKADEIKEVAFSGVMPEEVLERLRRRKEEIQEYAGIELPDVIYGDEPPAPLTRSRVKKELAGLAASRGYHRGRVKVVRGLSEFHKLEEGDVLVIPYSDVSWTPIFTKAGAVVSASGGILSLAGRRGRLQRDDIYNWLKIRMKSIPQKEIVEADRTMRSSATCSASSCSRSSS